MLFSVTGPPVLSASKGRLIQAAFALFTIQALLPLSRARAEEEKWLVPTAEVRLKMEIEDKPSVPEAGIVAIIQNGGLLPQPAPDPVVFDSGGKELKSECIWNNPREGFGIVFEPPTDEGPVSIYFKKNSTVRAWTPQSHFRPSLLLYTEAGKHSLADAKNMGLKIPAGGNARMGLVPMVADRSNRFGSSEKYVSYYSGWLNVPEDGPIYYGTISSDGSAVMLDGKPVADWSGEHTYKEEVPGQHGRSVAVGKGAHRFEYLHFSANPMPQAQFIWRIAATAKGHSDTPANKDWVRSGSGRIVSAETRAGAFLAMFEKKAIKYAGYDGVWIDLFELSIPLTEKATDIEATWDLGDKHSGKGTHVLWPVVRGDLPTVRLSLKSGHGTTTSSRMLYLDDRPEETHVGDAADRAMWQEALLNRVNGAPHRKHVADDWPKSFWTMLPEIIEPGEAEELLGELFEHSFDELQNLTSEAREKLEDIYLEELEILPDKAKALAFLTRAIADQKEPERRIHWQIKQIDYYLFEVGDLKIARRLADQLQSGPLRVGPVDAALRLVQRGDIERLDGDLDKAQQFYASAQQEYRRSMATPGSGAALGSAMDRPVAPQKPQTGPPSAAGMVIEAAKGTQTDWRVRAVRQNARFTHVNSLLDQHYIAEARQAFEQWIVEFPFSKLSGDYVLAEARYYSLIGNDARAVRILKAYRKQTEISNELPPAMELELKCLVALKTTGTSGAGRQADIKELCDDMKKRFPDLPLAQEADKATEEVQPPPQTIRAFPTFPK